MGNQRRETIVMFPFMAQGHIIPFLALAQQLEQQSRYDVVFVNTPLNVKKLRQSLPPTSTIQLRQLPFDSSDHGFSPGVENTDVLPPPLVVPFVQASASLKPAFRELLAALAGDDGPPLCVVADIFFGWSAEVAREFGAFQVVFSGAGAFGLACYYSLWMNLPHLNRGKNSGEFTLPDFQEAGVFDETYLTPTLSAANGNDPDTIYNRRNMSAWSDSDGFLFNSIAELDHLGLDYFRRKLKKPIWAIGPLVLNDDRRSRTGINPDECLNWLNSKPQNSVLYVSFGSMNTISASQMMQLATALESTEVNFIWVVRPPVGYDVSGEFKTEEWLPEGFLRRVSGRGLVIEQWAPQVEILSHGAVKVFLSHCGWNSVLEALSGGVAVLGWPLAAEQFYNSKVLEEKIGVAVEVARGSNMEVRSEGLVEKIELVMGESEIGKKIRDRAFEVKKMIEDGVVDDDEGGFKGSSVKAMEEFLIKVTEDRSKSQSKTIQ